MPARKHKTREMLRTMLSALRINAVPRAEGAWSNLSLTMLLATSMASAGKTLSAEPSNVLNAVNNRRSNAKQDQLIGPRDAMKKENRVRITERTDTRSKTSSERRDVRPS